MRWTTIVLLVLMVVIVFANVVSRYYLHASLAWSEEVARFMLVWLVFIGSFLAYIHDEHLGLDILVAKMPPTLRKIVAFGTNMMILFALYAVMEGGYLLMRDNFDWLSSAAEIPQGYVYFIVPFTCGLMMLQVVLKTYYLISGQKGRQEGSAC
jgi:TRAP-type C4-dicarboxylate transport system permease small subunit